MLNHITGLDLIHFGGGILMGLAILGVMLTSKVGHTLDWASTESWLVIYLVGYILSKVI